MGCGVLHRTNLLLIGSPARFLLFVLFVLEFLSLVQSAPTLTPFQRHVERQRLSPSAAGSSYVRHYKLHSRCSGRHVMVRGRQVEALAPKDSEYARLRVETVSFDSLVRIQSAVTRDYLCFNKHGRLVVKHSGKSNRCVFQELHALNDFTEFRSAANSTWYLGFRRSGQRLGGDQWTRDRHPVRGKRCYQFVKTDQELTLGQLGGDDVAQPWAPKIDYHNWYAKLMATKREPAA